MTALVIGGTSGVGLEVARGLLRDGHRVMIVGRDGARAQAALTQLAMEGDVTSALSDLSDSGEAARIVATAAERLGSIDIAVCSTVPNTIRPDLLSRLDAIEIPAILTSLAVPPMQLTRAVAPVMEAGGRGSIVLVASDAAKVPTVGETVIGGAMAAITMFTRAAAMELKRAHIRVNAVTPSIITDTPTGERMLSDGFSSRLFEKAIATSALGETHARDVAEAVLFLAGDRASRITGQVLSVNGGISAG